MKTRIMLDLETLGTAPGSAILAIGAVKFTGGQITGEFYKRVNLRSCTEAGLTIDPDTVLWWLKQSDEARLEIATRQEQAGTLAHILDLFSLWTSEHTDDPVDMELWGNGASFDNVLLAEAWRAVHGVEPAWAHRKSMCYRTVKNLYPDVPMPRTGTHHNALDDARSQAMHLMAMIPSL